MQRAVKIKVSPLKLLWAWEVGQCNPLQRCIITPQSCIGGGSAPAARSMQPTLCKNACITPKMQGGGVDGRPAAAGLMQCSAKMHVVPSKMRRAWAGALLHLGQCNSLQKFIHHPQKCRGSAPAARLTQSFAKMHISLPKMRGVGGKSRQPLAKLYHCPAKAAWGVRDTNARVSAVQKYLNSPKNGVGEGFCIPPSSSLDAPVQTKPPQTQECITGVGARALLLIAGFKPKKGREKV